MIGRISRKHIFYRPGLWVLCGLLLWAACGKDPIPPPVPPTPPCVEACDTSILKLLWQTPIGADTGDYYSFKPNWYHDKVIVSKMFGGPEDVLIGLNRHTGAIEWSWDNPMDIYDGEKIGSIVQTADERLVVCSWHEINVINMNDGTSLWRSDANDQGGCGLPRITLIHDQIYHTHKPCGTFKDSSFLVRSSIYHPQWDTLFRLGSSDIDHAPNIETGTLWVNLQGDSIYIFQNRAADANGDQVDLYALNLKTKDILWKIADIDEVSTILPPEIHDGKLYFKGVKTLFCLKPEDGTILWQKQFAAGLYWSTLVFADNRVIIHPNDHNIYALDRITGAEIWHSTNTGGTPTALSRYKDYVFYASEGSGGIYIHNISDGALVKRIQSPNRDRYSACEFTRPLAIDPDNKRLYITDGRFVVCYEIKI